MSLYRDEAVVLRTQKLGEADRIITLLTRERGKVRAVAKGVRKTTSRLGSRVEPFMLIDVQLYEGRSLDIVTQVETVGAYGLQIASDYGRYTAGTAMLETTDRLVDSEGEPALQLFVLLAGWAPSFTDCVRCGATGPHRGLSIAAGGSVCPLCRPAGSVAPHRETLDLLAALLTGDWTVADASDERRRRESSGIVAAYLQWHLERQVRSLRLVER